MDPLDEARGLLALARLVFRARRHAARRGIQPAEAAARRAETLGRHLADAVARAEKAEGEARADILEEVARLGERLAADIQPWESIQELVGLLTIGARGDRPMIPRPPRRLDG